MRGIIIIAEIIIVVSRIAKSRSQTKGGQDTLSLQRDQAKKFDSD